MVAHGKKWSCVSEVERKCFWKPVTELKIKMHEYSLSIKGNGDAFKTEELACAKAYYEPVYVLRRNNFGWIIRYAKSATIVKTRLEASKVKIRKGYVNLKTQIL